MSLELMNRSDKCKYLTNQSYQTTKDKSRWVANEIMTHCENAAIEGYTRYTVSDVSRTNRKVFAILIENGFNVVPKSNDQVVVSWSN